MRRARCSRIRSASRVFGRRKPACRGAVTDCSKTDETAPFEATAIALATGGGLVVARDEGGAKRFRLRTRGRCVRTHSYKEKERCNVETFVGAAAAGAVRTGSPQTGSAKADATPIVASGETTAATKPLDDFVIGCDAQIRASVRRASRRERMGDSCMRGHSERAIWRRRSRHATPRDRFRIASSSKPFTGGRDHAARSRPAKLHLDDRAFDILSSFAPPNGRQEDPRLRTITRSQPARTLGRIRQHENAIRSSTRCVPLPTRWASRAPRPTTTSSSYMMGRPLAFDPGSKYLYSNLGYNILGPDRGTRHRHEVRSCGRVRAFSSRPASRAWRIGKSKRKDIFADEVEAWDPPTFTTMYSVFEDQDEIVPYRLTAAFQWRRSTPTADGSRASWT